MFRASMCPSSGENCCTYATLIFITLYGWRLVCGWIESNQQTSRHPYRVTNTSVAQTHLSPDDGHMDARNMRRRVINKYIKKNCASSWIYLRDYTEKHGQQNIKFLNYSSSASRTYRLFFVSWIDSILSI